MRRGASCDSYGGGVWTLLLFPGAGGGGYSHNFIWPIRGCAAVQGMGFYLSVRNRYLVISLESMYFRVRVSNLQWLTYTQILVEYSLELASKYVRKNGKGPKLTKYVHTGAPSV